MILSKKQMTEEDIKLITMETKVFFTEGKVNLRGNLVSREKPKKADYILYHTKNHPLAIVEAKDNNHSVSL